MEVFGLMIRRGLIFIVLLAFLFSQGCSGKNNHHKIKYIICEVDENSVMSEFEIVSGERLSAELEGDQLVFKNESVVKAFSRADVESIIIRTYREPEFYHVDMTFNDDANLYIFGLLTDNCKDVLIARMQGVEVHLL